MKSFAESWQADYEAATGKRGTVRNVFGRMGRFGGLAIWVEVEEGDETFFYSPWLDSCPYDECPDPACEDCMRPEFDDASSHCDGHRYELDETAWIDSMTGATNWGAFDWGEGESTIPEH